MYIVLLGAPGTGKGTIAKLLSNDLKLSHISTGEIFRNEMKHDTKLGNEISDYMKNGLLVPDDIVIEVIENRLQEEDVKRGAILDGFPRTVVQAEVLEKFLTKFNPSEKIVTIELNVPDEEIIKRISNRLTCSNKTCGAIYNLDSKPPKTEGICDICGNELVKRADDNEETVRKRLEIYHENSKDLLEFYRKNDALYSVNSKELEKTISNIREYLMSVKGSN